MLYLAIIYHMHQPYYKNLLTNEVVAPWVRLHAIKDYLDMILLLKDYPKIHLTFNLTPCLIEQIQDYTEGAVQDKYLSLSYKPAENLTPEDKQFILENFFHLYPDYGIAVHPRYYQLYLKRHSPESFNVQDLLDLQVWFNLAWFDPSFRKGIPELKNLVEKGRFFIEEEKCIVLDKQTEILEKIIPAYKESQTSSQIEIITNPYYHPILPLLYNSKIAKEANSKATLPRKIFEHPGDAQSQIQAAIQLYQKEFGRMPDGMWPSEQAVSEHILPLIIQSGIKWIVTDESILYKSLKKRRRITDYLYQPYQLKRKEGVLNIVFRDRNLSDLISFVYHRWKAEHAVSDFLKHLKNIEQHFRNENPLVVVALDGENAWEYYKNDGWDFLTLLYERLSSSDFLKTTTISEHLANFPPENNIAYLKPGSWVEGNFNKWIGSELKNRAWEYLIKARGDLESLGSGVSGLKIELIEKQIHIAEGSDWFWWYGDTDDEAFDELFRMHLANFYRLLDKPIPEYLNKSIT